MQAAQGGGVMGAAWMAKQANVADVITYDMGGTSTDVALVAGGTPQWTTTSTIDGLPIGLQIVGRHFAEPLLLELAHTMERNRPWPLTATATS